MALSDEPEALAKRHGALSYRNRADTQNPAFGFSVAGLESLLAEVRGDALEEAAYAALGGRGRGAGTGEQGATWIFLQNGAEQHLTGPCALQPQYTIGPIAHQQAVAQAGPYTAPELRTWLRPGADGHERYPSRMGNVRLWRGGRREVAA